MIDSLLLLLWLIINIAPAITLCAPVKDYRKITFKNVRHIVHIKESSTTLTMSSYKFTLNFTVNYITNPNIDFLVT
jgi:hypothetical protein